MLLYLGNSIADKAASLSNQMHLAVETLGLEHKMNNSTEDDLKHNRTTISKIYNAFNGTTIINNEEKITCKERIIINYKTENIFNKHINGIEMENFNLINLFKIYKDANEFEADFID